MISEVAAATLLASDAIADAAKLDHTVSVTDRDTAWAAVTVLRDLVSVARELAETIEAEIAETVPYREHVTLDGQPYKVVRDRSYRDWDHEALVRAVLDTRLVDKETGEVVDESPLEKVRSVWKLAGYQASRNGLRARGLQSDEFCIVEDRRLKLAAVR